MRRLLLGAALLVALLASATAALAVPATNPANRLAGTPIDDGGYDRATHCVKSPKPGATALVRWLQGHVGGEFWGIMRCEKWGPKSASLHAEGRAIDWHLDRADPASRREAYKLIDLLLDDDRDGNQYALARRMGVQEIIYDCKAWFASGQLRKYSYCYDKHGKRKKNIDRTAGHLDHIHLGLSKRGAAKKTSFWKSAAAQR